ncbi:hypothetical protein Rhopal_000769-T1 [Rhodotorula paludigena]|uniref:Uncharacterized protein n=1 Tax=Rhodotorula paludigena TaxID=86838 RepID=A0AAV5GEN7_9BASI|nr:hypothetical protein Rhopal_000769-T1 [Rhodotorula paludigena]
MSRPSSTRAAALCALLFSLGVAAQNQVATPQSIYQCTPASVSYTCVSPPCTVVARPSDDPGSSLATLGEVNDQSGSVSWRPVDAPEGTSVTFWITDSNGATISSAPITVAAGSDDCLNGGGSSASAGGASSSGSSASTDASSTGATSSGRGTSSAASTAGTSTASHSGASTASGDEASETASPSSDSKDGDNSAAGLAIKGSALFAGIIGLAAMLA